MLRIILTVLLILNFLPTDLMAAPKRKPRQFYGAPSYSARMLILRHSPDEIGLTDANQAIEVVKKAAQEGLKIEVLGNYFITKVDKKFISDQMKLHAVPGDTFVIYTIGHGGGDGGLANVGKRTEVMKIFAEAAEENDQETFWWQLSCHAAAGLPSIASLTPNQQRLFSALASSPANELSYFCTQAAIMAKVFVAMAKQDPAIDPNKDDVITADEMRGFLNTLDSKKKKGDLFFAATPQEEIFGRLFLASLIPIVDRNNPQREYDKHYVPVPRRP
jgi:hypothetical protein